MAWSTKNPITLHSNIYVLIYKKAVDRYLPRSLYRVHNGDSVHRWGSSPPPPSTAIPSSHTEQVKALPVKKTQKVIYRRRKEEEVKMFAPSKLEESWWLKRGRRNSVVGRCRFCLPPDTVYCSPFMISLLYFITSAPWKIKAYKKTKKKSVKKIWNSSCCVMKRSEVNPQRVNSLGFFVRPLI